MVINQDVQDIDNYPGTVKRITLDVDTIVPTGTEGDEKMLMVASTSAYSDNVERTAIQDIYAFKSNVGWAKSSGMRGTAGKFALTSTTNKIAISLDATVSGTRQIIGQGYYEIDLDYNIDETAISGEDIATDLQTKIRAIIVETADSGFQLSYSNCSIKFDNGKFIIASGSISNSYIGVDRSSVSVAAGSSNDCSTILGFDHTLTSESIAGIIVTETLITQNYTADTGTLYIGANTGAVVGDSLYITNGTNEDYFTAINITDGTDVTVAVSGTNGFAGILNDYTIADGSYVQVLRKQDPDVRPLSYFEDMDATLRYMAKNLINQIDFSS